MAGAVTSHHRCMLSSKCCGFTCTLTVAMMRAGKACFDLGLCMLRAVGGLLLAPGALSPFNVGVVPATASLVLLVFANAQRD